MHFPTAPQLLATLVGQESHTQQGQVAIAEQIADFARQWDLGDVRVEHFPPEVKFSGEEPILRNIVIEAGSGTEEIIVYHGHFDTVPPSGYLPSDHPLQLTQDPHNNDIFHGLGSFDMKAGVVAILMSLYKMRTADHRKIRAILVAGEENQSEGTHAALQKGHNSFDKACGVISTEIPVLPEDAPYPMLIIGRPGRIGLRLTIEGVVMHAGNVTRHEIQHLLSERIANALHAIPHIHLSEHPNDYDHLMSQSMCVPTAINTQCMGALSVAGKGSIDIAIHYTNPTLSVAEIMEMVRRHLDPVLQNSYELSFKLEQEPGRQLPFTQPWLESPHHPFIQKIRAIQQDHVSTTSPHTVPLYAGRGVADEGVIVHQQNIPAVCIPPHGGGEHTRNEHVHLSSITGNVVPTLRAIASYDGSLF
jgi:acetylornithine deacetylase/succinyl-diaminopimelate desuccinylase-like protein